MLNKKLATWEILVPEASYSLAYKLNSLFKFTGIMIYLFIHLFVKLNKKNINLSNSKYVQDPYLKFSCYIDP